MKILIWDLSFNLRPTGGPSGYLYNIHEFLKENPSTQILFLSDIIGKRNNPIIEASGKNSFVTTLKETFLGKFLHDIRVLYGFYYKKERELIQINLSEYDFIHFHLIYDLIRYSNSLNKYSGCIVLTSHMPEIPFDETVSTYINNKKFTRFFRNLFVRREIKILEKYVNKWIFPSIYSLEPYINSSVLYDRYFKKMRNNIINIPTGILDQKIDREEGFYTQYGIPKDAVVILYIGRHNMVKGYDELKRIAASVLEQEKNVYFVIAGKEEPLKRLNHPHWIELGWVNNSPQLISNADLFILPNQETYFDLVALEVLRADTPILLTETGGNKYFIYDIPSEKRNGIKYYKKGKVDDAIHLIKSIINNIDGLRGNNRKLWEEYFTVKVFVSHYIEFINGEKTQN